MREGELQSYVENLTQLPTLPPVAVRIMEVAGDLQSTRKQLTGLLETDQSLASKILRIANSSTFGTSRQVSTVERAVALLGFDFVRSLSLSVLLVESTRTQSDGVFSMNEFWHHSLACAIASELIARKLRYPQPSEAFIGGLLHDLGKLVIFSWNRELYEKVSEKAKEKRRSLLEQEEVQLGLGHTEVGKALMDRWKFPASLVAASWLHHQPIEEFGSSQGLQLPAIVKCANCLCHLKRFGFSGNTKSDLTQTQLVHAIGLPDPELYKISISVLKRFEEISHHFDWESAGPELFLSAVRRANEESTRMHMELMAQHRELFERQQGLETACHLARDIRPDMTLAVALETATDLLGSLLSYRRLIVLAPDAANNCLLVRLKRESQTDFTEAALPLEEGVCRATSEANTGNQILMIREILGNAGTETKLCEEIISTLHSPRVLVIPLKTEDEVLGQLIVELSQSEVLTPTRSSVIEEFGTTAAILIKRTSSHGEIHQQTELMARSARRVETTQRQLSRAEQMAALGQLAAGTAHEINSPLATIGIHAQVLLRTVKDETGRKSLTVILEQLDKISNLINDMMAASKPPKPQLEPTDVRSVLKDYFHDAGVHPTDEP